MSSDVASSQSKFLEHLVEIAKQAFTPSEEESKRELGQREYRNLIDRADDWALISALNTLIKPGILPSWLREPLLQTLAEIPLRPTGVRATLEFVFSVHPSSQNVQAAGPQKEGASITHEAVAMATKMLSSPPQKVEARAWFQGISGQLFSLIDGDGGPELAKTAAQVVGFGILGRKQYGAPGSAGWDIFVHPMIASINPSLSRILIDDAISGARDDEIIDLTKPTVIVSSHDLARSLQRLRVLILSNASPGLCIRVLKPVLLQLWSLASWVEPPKATDEKFCTVARSLIETYMRLFGKFDNIRPILKHLLARGSLDPDESPWMYFADGDGISAVVQKNHHAAGSEVNLTELTSKASTFVELHSGQCKAEETSFLFLHLLKSYIQKGGQKQGIKIDLLIEESGEDTSLQDLIDMTILQQLMEKSPEQLVAQFAQLLQLIVQVLQVDEQSPFEEDLISVVLSLLNLVITAPTFQRSDVKEEPLEMIEKSLERLSGQDRGSASQTAKSLSLLLRYHDDLESDRQTTRTAPSTQHVEDRRTYNLALSYITGVDNPPPVVSEGLNLISGLIVQSSPILDVTTVTALMSTLLKDNDDYINLRVIKIFNQLANRHPKNTMTELLDQYFDKQEILATDVRLRFGEALLQVIERLGQAFEGDLAKQAGEVLLLIGGRRGHRPRTMARQVKDEKRREMKRQKERANADDDNNDEDLDMAEDQTEEEKANNETITQILHGWESKRGSEDIRMRTSALSIFGSALETNIAGVGATLVSSGVDLCINILSMEKELPESILRRAALTLISNFATALHKVKESKKALGFGLTDQSRQDISQVLQYVAATDKDGLVRDQAKDVVDMLDALKMGELDLFMTEQQQARGGSGFARLAGLVVNPVTAIGEDSGSQRPRIEEIE